MQLKAVGVAFDVLDEFAGLIAEPADDGGKSRSCAFVVDRRNIASYARKQV